MAYYKAQAEKSERLLAKMGEQLDALLAKQHQQSESVRSKLRNDAVTRIMSSVAVEDADLRSDLLEYVREAITIGDDLSVDTSKAERFASRFAAQTPAAPAPTTSQPRPVATPPPAADLAPPRAKDWRDRLSAATDHLAATISQPGALSTPGDSSEG